jgi:threonine dehydratase
MALPTCSDVEAARRRIQGAIRRTPTIRCTELEREGGPELWLKLESLQHVGAFKARGAHNAVAKLSNEQRQQGLLTYSSGNHAQAVALAGKRFGVPVVIAMPEDAPTIKVESVRSLGAKIIFAGTTSTDRKQAAHDYQTQHGGIIIEPFDHFDTIAGQGTATLELLEQMAEMQRIPDALIAPVGGGGLIAGAAVALTGTNTRLYSAEPEGCDALRQSLGRGELCDVVPGPTLADGLKPTRIGELNFEILKGRVTDSFAVDDREIGEALVRLLVRAHLLIEPSAAAALAVALREPLDGAQTVAVLVSGGNVAPELVAELIEQHRKK